MKVFNHHGKTLVMPKSGIINFGEVKKIQTKFTVDMLIHLLCFGYVF